MTSNQVYIFLVHLQNVPQSLLTPTIIYSRALFGTEEKARETSKNIKAQNILCGELNIYSNLLAFLQVRSQVHSTISAMRPFQTALR